MNYYRLFLIKNSGKRYNITGLCSNLEWQDNIDTLGTQLNFTFARNTDDRYKRYQDLIEVGDKVILFNNSSEIFRGIITDLDIERYARSVTAFDYAFYLNKNKLIIQFKNMNADKAIVQLCSKFDISVNVKSMATKITKIYKDDTVSGIISDILNQVTDEFGYKYFYEMKKDKLYIRKLGFEIIKPKYRPAVNVGAFDSLKAIGTVGKTESISEMKNSILVASSEEKSTRIFAKEKDKRSIDKYGLLQEVVSVDKKNSSQAHNIARNKLRELNKITKDIDIEFLGDDSIKCGRVLEIDNSTFNLKGKYLIKASNHSITQNNIHKVNLNLEEI